MKTQIKDLTKLSGNYAVIRQKRGKDTDINEFLEINGKALSKEEKAEISVTSFFAKYQGKEVAVIFDVHESNEHTLEFINYFTNQFSVHAITGNEGINVVIKYKDRITYDTPIMKDIMIGASLEDLSVIIDHVRHLHPNGRSYTPGFIPQEQYMQKGGLRQWLKKMIG